MRTKALAIGIDDDFLEGPRVRLGDGGVWEIFATGGYTLHLYLEGSDESRHVSITNPTTFEDVEFATVVGVELQERDGQVSVKARQHA